MNEKYMTKSCHLSKLDPDSVPTAPEGLFRIFYSNPVQSSLQATTELISRVSFPAPRWNICR